jgi:hypothetical protein
MAAHDSAAPVVLPTSPSHDTYQGFITVPGLSVHGCDGGCDAWVRLEGVGSGGGISKGGQPHPLRHARLVLGPELDGLLQVWCEMKAGGGVPEVLLAVGGMARGVAVRVGRTCLHTS